MTTTFDGQVALVTGASRGLGLAYARLLARLGASVVLNDVPQEAAALADAVKAIRAEGGLACADEHDLVLAADQPVATALRHFGRLDIVINNAGTTGGGTIDNMPWSEFERIMAVNVNASVGVLRAAWPVFVRQQYGRVVNTSSGSVFGLPGCYAYQTSKAALIGLTRSLALDGAAHGIKVNAINPSAYSRMTEAIPDKAFVDFLRQNFPAEKAASFVLALVSRDVPCTGEWFVVGGGLAARATLGLVPGLVLRESVDPSDWLQRFDEVMNAEGMHLPATCMEVIVHRAAEIGAELHFPTHEVPNWSKG